MDTDNTAQIEYFPPAMSRRRMPDTPIPPSLWDDCFNYDQMLMNWTTAFVEDSLGPAALRVVKETAPKTRAPASLDGTRVLVGMYEAFKGEGMRESVRLSTHRLTDRSFSWTNYCCMIHTGHLLGQDKRTILHDL